jgi:hypothetical protein
MGDSRVDEIGGAGARAVQHHRQRHHSGPRRHVYETRLRESKAENGQKPPDNPTPQQAWDSRSPTVPMKVGWLQPDDISPVAVFLASDAANLVTGAEYEVTAGDSAKDV